jgi:hypothetical protein
MTPIPGPTLQTLRCRTVSSGGFQQLNYLRDLPPLTIEEQFGPPTDAAVATPLETLLAALGSCLAARIHANAAAGSILVNSLEIEVEADIGPSSMWNPPGQEPGSPGFASIRVAVFIEANASRGALDSLVANAKLWSPVANTLHDPVHLDVTIQPPGSRIPEND